MKNDWFFKVWETKHEEEFLGEMSAREVIKLLNARPLTDEEFCGTVNMVAAMNVGDADGDEVCETVYIRADWTLDIARTR